MLVNMAAPKALRARDTQPADHRAYADVDERVLLAKLGSDKEDEDEGADDDDRAKDEEAGRKEEAWVAGLATASPLLGSC
jgi:hypothetical protein